MAGRILDWPEEERPRERLMNRGVQELTDGELVALLIRSGSARESAIVQARCVLDAAGGLRHLATASAVELARVPGIGPAKAATLVAAFELGRRTLTAAAAKGAAFGTSAAVYAHFRGRLSMLKKEVFSVLLLDAKHRKLRDVQISEGSLTSSIVHPREVFAPAVRESAAAMILIHNHPSGDPAPSPEDVEITRRLRQVGDLVGIRVLDHVIVGLETHFSFVDAGYW